MNSDARISVTLPTHPKTKKLIRRSGYVGAWSLMRLFLWVSQNRPSGDLAGLSDEDLELAVDWPDQPGEFVRALAEVGFLDGGEGSRSVHDWAVHNPWAVGAVDRQAKARAAADARWGARNAIRTPASKDSSMPVAPRTDQKVINPATENAPSIDKSCSEHATSIENDARSNAPILSFPFLSSPIQNQKPCDDAAAPTPPVPVKAKRKPKADDGEPSLNVRTWEAYATAYREKKGIDPVRNAKVNGQIAQLTQRIGQDAPEVAAHFVGSRNAYYVQRGHSIDALLRDCEKIRTEWATGRNVTATQARLDDRTASNGFLQLLNSQPE